MLRQAIITSKTANAIAVVNTVIIVANERTYITPCSNVRNSFAQRRQDEGPSLLAGASVRSSAPVWESGRRRYLSHITQRRTFLSRSDPAPGLVHLRQSFVRC